MLPTTYYYEPCTTHYLPRTYASIPASHQVCRAWQLLPGPETHRAIEWLRARVACGALRSGQPYAYYLEALDEEYGGVRVGVNDVETNA